MEQLASRDEDKQLEAVLALVFPSTVGLLDNIHCFGSFPGDVNELCHLFVVEVNTAVGTLEK